MFVAPIVAPTEALHHDTTLRLFHFFFGERALSASSSQLLTYLLTTHLL